MILLSVDGMESEFDSDIVLETVVSTKTELQPPKLVSQDEEIETTMNHDSITNYIVCPDVSGQDAGTIFDKAAIKSQPSTTDNLCENQVTPKRCMEPNYGNYLDLEDSSVNKSWSQWKPKSLRSKKHPALTVPKSKRPFEKLAESKLEMAEIQRLLLEEELQNKRKQWSFEEKEREEQQKRWNFEEEEREHKRQMWALEKKCFVNNDCN